MYRYVGQPDDTPTRFDVLGYPDKWVAHPGDTISFMLSCEGMTRYRARIVRVISGDNTIGGPGFKVEPVETAADGDYEARVQTSCAGSFGVAPASSHDWWRVAFCVTATIQPTAPGMTVQTVLAAWNAEASRGFALLLNEQGCLEARIGDGSAHEAFALPVPIASRGWTRVEALFDPASGRLRLEQVPVAVQRGPDYRCAAEHVATVRPDCGGAQFSFAGVPITGAANPAAAQWLFNGKIEAPSIEATTSGNGSRSSDFAVRWNMAGPDFESDMVSETGPEGLSAKLVNYPTRAVAGSNWTGAVLDWRQARDQYAAIHFHDDDLESANWTADITVSLPENLRSGIYALHVLPLDGAEEEQDYLTFFVSPRPGRAKSRTAVLASTYTYQAYSNSHILSDDPDAEFKGGFFLTLNPEEVFLNQRRDLGLSLYDRHSDGSGVAFSSRLRPTFSMRLRQSLWSLNADTLLIDWFEAQGRDYDLITDDDIHEHGLDVLSAYDVLVTGAHPEYWSTRMLDALEAYTANGGHLMYLGGNGFYWRIAVDENRPWMMEVRRVPDGIRFWEAKPGEDHHAVTGEFGGLWRRIGRAPQGLCGVGTVATGFDSASAYRKTPAADDPRAAFVFAGVETPEFGATGLLGGAAGGEIDAADPELGTPSHALVLARSFDHSRFYHLSPEETPTHHMAINGEDNPRCVAEMVFYECAGGGAVFSVGSCNWLASLFVGDYDNPVSVITGNVLDRFTAEQPFRMPAASRNQASQQEIQPATTRGSTCSTEENS